MDHRGNLRKCQSLSAETREWPETESRRWKWQLGGDWRAILNRLSSRGGGRTGTKWMVGEPDGSRNCFSARQASVGDRCRCDPRYTVWIHESGNEHLIPRLPLIIEDVQRLDTGRHGGNYSKTIWCAGGKWPTNPPRPRVRAETRQRWRWGTCAVFVAAQMIWGQLCANLPLIDWLRQRYAKEQYMTRFLPVPTLRVMLDYGKTRLRIFYLEKNSLLPSGNYSLDPGTQPLSPH